MHGLVALMELQASRARARVGRRGEPILLADQDRSRWDWLLIRRGLDALARAESLQTPLGLYTLQAAIAACHARAPSVGVRGDLLQRLGRIADARAEFERAAALATNAREKQLLLARAKQLE